MTFMAIGIAVAAGLGVLLIVFGLTMSLSPRPGDLLEARLAQFTESGRLPTTLTEVELSLPFFERAIRPALDKMGAFITKGMRSGSLEALQEDLNLAGRPWGITASGFYLVRILSLLLFCALGFAVSVLLTFDMPMWLTGPVGGAVLGYLVPQMILKQRIKK